MLDLKPKAGSRALISRACSTIAAYWSHVRGHREVKEVARENRQTEFKACNGIGVPYLRIPQEIVVKATQFYGKDCWGNDDFIQWFGDNFPEFRVRVNRGTKGQEYHDRVER